MTGICFKHLDLGHHIPEIPRTEKKVLKKMKEVDTFGYHISCPFFQLNPAAPVTWRKDFCASNIIVRVGIGRTDSARRGPPTAKN